MRNLSEQIIIELLRSFCFVYAVVTSFAFGLANDSSFPLIGLALVSLVHLFGKSSGSHFNPAVSLIFPRPEYSGQFSFLLRNLFAFLGYAFT